MGERKINRVICSREDLVQALKRESQIYCNDDMSQQLIGRFVKSERYMIWRYVKYLRWEEYYENMRYSQKKGGHKLKSKLYAICRRIAQRKKNSLGHLLDIEVGANMTGVGLNICHRGIIVNGLVGKNCTLHGDNCIGNKGVQGEGKLVPELGDNVDVGVGAKIIGNIVIGSNCKIGAGAVVTKSFRQDGLILVGIPARERQ